MIEEYEWENCVRCGRSEYAYALATGFAMLLWHTEIGPLCEFCYGDYKEPEEIDEQDIGPPAGMPVRLGHR